ncbi:hypothetical protein [Sphingobium lactosutens]|uniref:Uncharacterized protein n=1 Tax=Sphingobium lactosutens DS20 TaxID=1331060 RepID=T0HJR4_9SPHN|nr:hypothetical protein [Sphingobium lactosutens]EQB13252.1 hypothetical protein RLDS_16065 [Sphingobium lactosutens DS20]
MTAARARWRWRPEVPDPASDDGEKARLQEVISLCRRRVDRAREKLCAAQVEQADADASLLAAEQRLARWIEANPDPQRSIFEELTNV